MKQSSAFGARGDRPGQLGADHEVGLDMKPLSQPTAVRGHEAPPQFRPANVAGDLAIGGNPGIFHKVRSREQGEGYAARLEKNNVFRVQYGWPPSETFVKLPAAVEV